MLAQRKAVDENGGDWTVPPDEGWWAAVLADEEGVNTHQKEASVKMGSSSLARVVDWDAIRSLFEKDEVVTLKVYGYNRGGLLVEGSNLQGFVPISHLIDIQPGLSEVKRRTALADYIGKNLCLKVIECEPEEDRVVFSERASLAGSGQRQHLFDILTIGKQVRGKVTNITDFGVFVDLGGLEGLIHVSEISWGRVVHPSDTVSIGQEVEALVLQVYEETGRVALSMKRLTNNPWETINSLHRPGDVVPAVITSLARFGIFARLDEGVEGLIHISSLAVPNSETDLARQFRPGQPVQVRILHIDAKKRRLGLSLVAVVDAK
jgi:small subunit ribosomal protein S1